MLKQGTDVFERRSCSVGEALGGSCPDLKESWRVLEGPVGSRHIQDSGCSFSGGLEILLKS